MLLKEMVYFFYDILVEDIEIHLDSMFILVFKLSKVYKNKFK
jgi:hypothetical protein